MNTEKTDMPLTKTIESMLEARIDLLRRILPQHLTPERIIKVSLLARSRNPLLLQCTADSFLLAILQCAEIGLEPSGAMGGAHLVPFKNKKTEQYEAILIVDYRGLMDLARRSGQIRSIEAHIIHKLDSYDVEFGIDAQLKHRPCLEGDPGEMVAVYAMAKLADGATQVHVMSRYAVDKIRSRSRAAQFGPWVTDYEEMAKKTVIRQICKYLPKSREMQNAIDLDDATEHNEAPLVDLELPEDVRPKKPTQTEAVKAALMVAKDAT